MSLPGVKVIPNPTFAELPDSYKLSAEQRKYYDDNGYFVIKELIDFASLYSYKQRFSQMAKGLVATAATIIKEPSLVEKKLNPEDYINKIQDIAYDDVFVQYAQNPRLLDVVSQLIGDDVTAVHSMIINKPPGTGRHPPHQDLFYFPFRPADKIVAAWTAIDDVTTDNGCLFVIPGSHKKETLYAHGNVPDSGKMFHGILDEDRVAPVGERVPLEMSPGDTVFFHPYLVHGSGPNVSKNYRKAITFHFANNHCHYIDVKGTVQEVAADDVMGVAKKKGFEIAYQDIWRYKSRLIKGVKSNL
ncbi:probable phytanoyl-CoA dioxygenase [Manduca sexta]|uniref:phytanoyl-CoA dioxygenase n=1 Tax=Manduca sexta TaxID=7130 RepID=A0A921ZJ49_MANSE|nr:probable phytanoyl-CoA dioxygenase [Manduca sexta]KAG6458423.1 hypothetical protein O3G_MSEX010855 [Manduca sexta]